MSDNIFALPSDKIPSTREETEMLDWLFPQKPKEEQSTDEKTIKNEQSTSINEQSISKIEEKPK